MSHFIQSGNSIKVFPGDAVDIKSELPVGNYILKHSPMQGFYLETAERFQQPKKIYGDCLKHADRVINTFEARGTNTGVMLVGEKGSGKTLLARQISIQSEYPTVIVNSSFSGEQFNSFLSGITQPCIILFDEFEKTYKKDEQEKILTLLDGTFQSQKLFMFTSNNKWELDNNLKNRPGRIFYLIEFSGLDEEFIKEYCKDNLVDQGKIGAILATSGLFDVFNFDMLVAFVQEVNRYGEDPSDLIGLLNAKPEYSGRQSYLVRNLEVAGVSIPTNKYTVDINSSVNSFSVPAYFYWSAEEAVKRGVKTQIGDIFYNDEVDFDFITEHVKTGLLTPGNPPPAPEGDTDIQHSYIRVSFFPEDIVKYQGTNSILYSNDGGCKAELVKSTKSKKRGLY